MIKPWIFEFFRAPTKPGMLVPAPREGVTADEVNAHFQKAWGQWLKLEELGYEGIFFSEHHFGPGYSPSPNLLIAALAPVTKTLRLGVMGVVLPYYQPWRVIEEMGMLDHLTNGRLEVGTASGIPPEMAQVGLGVAEANERNVEAQDLLDWALTHPGEAITHHGKYWNFDNLNLVPRLLQKPINRWTTVVSEGSARRAARRGTKICTGFNSVDVVKKVFDGYREDADAVGLAHGPDSFGIRRVVTLSRDGDSARALSAQVRDQIEKVFLKSDNRVNHGPVPDAPQKAHGGLAMGGEEYIAGNPQDVAEEIIRQCDAVGAGHFLAMIDAYPDEKQNREAFELFGQEVIPLLRKAGLSQAAGQPQPAVAGA